MSFVSIARQFGKRNKINTTNPERQQGSEQEGFSFPNRKIVFPMPD